MNWSHPRRVISDRRLAFGVLVFAVAFAIIAAVKQSPAYGMGAGVYAVIAIGWFVTHQRLVGQHRKQHRVSK